MIKSSTPYRQHLQVTVLALLEQFKLPEQSSSESFIW